MGEGARPDCIRRGSILLTCLACLVGAGCSGRSPEDGHALAPGDIGVPFRNRWWHFYERGLSWAEAGDDRAAEADLRQCLRLRQSDSRRARTYGLHFVQCFAQRELAAVLLRDGRLDEAETLLRLSLEQEPSAKAEWLLERVQALRTGAVPAAVPAPADTPARIELTRIEPGAGGIRVQGQLVAADGAVLWLRDAAGALLQVAADAAGSFQLTAATGASLALGDASGPQPGAQVFVAAPIAVPTLVLDGPADGQVVANGQAWYRWRGEAADGLATLTVEDGDGTLLARLPIDGVRAGGTLRLDLAGGPQQLRFTLSDRAGSVGTMERRVDAKPAPHQDRSLRAVALALPLQSPRHGALRPGDDSGLLAALLSDGRFRLLDRRADDLLTRELALVEAGLVDGGTAAAAGRRLASRYVIAGTVTHGERDAECYLRLVHSASGAVVASADAYVERGGSAAAETLFAAAAGRLRQVFPVISGPAGAGDGGRLRLALGGREGAVVHLRLHLFPGPPAPGAVPMGEAEVSEVGADESLARRVAGSLPADGWAVGE